MFIKVKVTPGSKKEEVIKKSADSLEVKVKEKPEKGQANKAVILALSEHFNISKEKIRPIRGAKKRNKMFEIL